MKKTAKKILSLLLTACLLMGSIALMIPAAVVPATAEAATTVSVSINGAAATTESLPYDLPSNTNVTINGVTFRFDDNGHGSPSGATINADGTVRLRMKNGDMFWMPSVTVSNSSTIQTVTTLTGSNCGGSGSAVYQHSSRHGFGPTWNIRANDGVWSGSSVKANVASFRPVSDGGSSALSILEMAATETYGDVSTAGLVDVTASSSSVFGASIDANSGKWNETLVTTVSYDGGAKAVAQDVKGATLATATYASGSLTGAVGFILTWGKWASMYEYTLSDLSIKNATVHGSSKSIFSLYALFTGMEALPLHEYVRVAGQTMRFDPLDTNIQSKWYVKDDIIRVKMIKGDMWTCSIASDAPLTAASMDVTYLSVKDSVSDSEFSAGMAYNIEYSGNHYTSCALAQVSTAARRGIGRVYADGSNGGSYGTAISTSPGGNMVWISSDDLNTTDFWYDENKAWVPGRTLRYSMAVGGEVVVSYGNTNGDVHTTASYTVGSGNESAPVGSFGFTGGWLDVYRTFEIANVSCTATNYQLDFSTIGDMELQPGYNIVGGHALYYVRNTGSGRAYISGGKLYLEGGNCDMILFDDLFVDGLAVTSTIMMTYLNDPGSSGFLGYLHNLSDPFQNVNANVADFATGTLVRTGAVTAVAPGQKYARFYKFSAGTYSAPYLINGGDSGAASTGVSVNSEFRFRTYTGVKNRADGKVGFDSPTWGSNYAHNSDFQKGVHGLVFAAGGAADSGLIKVKISSITISAAGNAGSTVSTFNQTSAVLPIGRYINLNSSNRVCITYPDAGNYTRMLVTTNGELIVRINPGCNLTATGLSGKTFTKLDSLSNADKKYTNNASVTRDSDTISCENAGATVVIKSYSATTESQIYNGGGTISTDGMIKLNFYCDMNCSMPKDAKLVARKGGVIIAQENIWDCYDSRAGQYVLSAPVAAKEMMDSVTFRVERNGSQISGSNSYTTTVKAYAEALVTADASWTDFKNALLIYGTAAQEYWDYNNNTSNKPASTSGITYNGPDVTAMTYTNKSYLVEDRIGLTVTLNSGTNLNLYVRPLHYYDQNATVTGASAVDSSGKSVSVTSSMNGDFWQITISDIKAEDLNECFTFTITVVDNSGTHNVTITCSALNWVNSIINSSTATANAKTLAIALGNYAAEAEKKA